MSGLRVLFIGGSGLISSACSWLAVERGLDVYALNRGATQVRPLPSDVIAAADPDWGAALLGDSAHSMIFDNSKLRSVVPDYVARITLEQAPEIIAWHDEDQSRQRVDPDLDSLMDKLSAEFRRPG